MGNWLLILTVISGVASILSVIPLLSRVPRGKALTYEATTSLPLVSVLPGPNKKLSIIFHRSDQASIDVDGVYVYFMRLANLGREPIRKEDLVRSDPLRLIVNAPDVLDVTLSSMTRSVTNLTLLDSAAESSGVTVVPIVFDFLDYRDGALIQVLTNIPDANLRLEGTIIGMPSGIIKRERSPRSRSILKHILWWGLPNVAYLSSLLALQSVFDLRKWFFAWLVYLGVLVSVAFVSSMFFSVLASWNASRFKGMALPSWFEAKASILHDKFYQ